MPKIIVTGDGTFFAASGQRLTAGEYETTDRDLIASALAVNLDWVSVVADDGLAIAEVPELPDDTPAETVKTTEPTLAELSGPLTSADFDAAADKAAAASAGRPVTPKPANAEPARGKG